MYIRDNKKKAAVDTNQVLVVARWCSKLAHITNQLKNSDTSASIQVRANSTLDPSSDRNSPDQTRPSRLALDPIVASCPGGTREEMDSAPAARRMARNSASTQTHTYTTSLPSYEGRSNGDR